MKKLLLITSIFCLTINAFAQEEKKIKSTERFKHSLGFGAGVSTGYGLSYRYFGEKFGAQVNFSPFKDETKLIVSSGLTFLYRIAEIDELSFFVYQANHFYFKEETVVNTSYDYTDTYETIETVTTTFEEDKYFNNGAGIGIEWVHDQRLGLNAMAGYGGQENFKKLNFTAEAAIYFMF